jgi:hypothetical protein
VLLGTVDEFQIKGCLFSHFFFLVSSGSVTHRFGFSLLCSIEQQGKSSDILVVVLPTDFG